MKYCEKCGKQLNDEAVFCEGGGTKVSEEIKEEVKQVFTCESCKTNYADTTALSKSSRLPLIIVIANIIILIVFVLFSLFVGSRFDNLPYKSGEIAFHDEIYCNPFGIFRSRAQGSYQYFSITDTHIDSNTTPQYIDGASLNYISGNGNDMLESVELPVYLFKEENFINENAIFEDNYYLIDYDFDDEYEGYWSENYKSSPPHSSYDFSQCDSLKEIKR